jgi:signal transduction histidine kinase
MSARPTDAARLSLAKLPPDLPLADALRHITATAAATLGVARAGVWLLVDDRRALRCVDLFENGGHSSGCTLVAADFPNYFAALEAARAVPAADARADPSTSELAPGYLEPLGITALLDAPIFLEGRVAGVVCHEAVGAPRQWTAEETDFVAGVADLIALRLKIAENADLRATLRALDAQQAETRKLEALGRLAAGVAHDFKNLLTVAAGAADLLARKPGLPPGGRELLGQVTDACERGGQLADELAHLGRSAGRPRVVGAADVVRGLLPLLTAAAGPDHPLTADLKPDAGKLFLDPAQLERALVNLVVNARDASPPGGPIAVRVAADNGGAVIAVADRGSGMTAEVRDRAFDPYFTTKGKGTGLGLAVVRQVAERAGGRVSVESDVGRGSEFRLHLPRVTGA